MLSICTTDSVNQTADNHPYLGVAIIDALTSYQHINQMTEPANITLIHRHSVLWPKEDQEIKPCLTDPWSSTHLQYGIHIPKLGQHSQDGAKKSCMFCYQGQPIIDLMQAWQKWLTLLSWDSLQSRRTARSLIILQPLTVVQPLTVGNISHKSSYPKPNLSYPPESKCRSGTW